MYCFIAYTYFIALVVCYSQLHETGTEFVLSVTGRQVYMWVTPIFLDPVSSLVPNVMCLGMCVIAS